VADVKFHYLTALSFSISEASNQISSCITIHLCHVNLALEVGFKNLGLEQPPNSEF